MNGIALDVEEPNAVTLSQDLKDFYQQQNVDLSAILNDNGDSSKSPFPHRFVRLNPRFDKEETLDLLEHELREMNTNGRYTPQKVEWLEDTWGFYALPGNFALATSQSFRTGRIYGMDVSSGAGVAALLSNAYDQLTTTDRASQSPDGGTTDSASKVVAKEIRVLDLCCCPGLKFCAMADYLGDMEATVVGVDISESRMALCKKIVQKYHIDPDTSGKATLKNGESSNEAFVTMQLFCQDGTTFGCNADNNLIFDSRAAIEDLQTRGKRKRMNKSARARERKRLKQLASLESVAGSGGTEQETSDIQSNSIRPFDYVLVDAECSTDGSLKHMKKRLKEGTKEESNLMLTDEKQLKELVGLQKALLLSGFSLLKQEGVLVYSTCSLSTDQNENVVKWLLETQKNAYLIPVHFPRANTSKLMVEGSLAGSCRFYPNVDSHSQDLFGDGFFLAKIGKKLEGGLTTTCSNDNHQK